MTTRSMESLEPNEVDARQPLLVRIVRDIIETHEALARLRVRRRNAGRGARAEGAMAGAAPAEAQTDPEGGAGSEELALREEERRLSQLLSTLQNEIEQLGGVLADPSTGLVEFPSSLEGRPVLLSWRPEDSRVAFYRRPEAAREDRVALPTHAGERDASSGEIHS